LRLPLGRSGLFAAAALAGAIVYWRASEQRRSRRVEDEIDEAITEGRDAAERLLGEPVPDRRQFDPN
jgi:hypothetical protein